MSQTLNQNVRSKVHTPWNRDCSCCVSHRGAVIHSAALRSTAFVDKEEHPESWASLQVWRGKQKALNNWINAIVGGYTLEAANESAFKALRPSWDLKIRPLQGGKVEYTATKEVRGLVEHQGAFSLAEILKKTR